MLLIAYFMHVLCSLMVMGDHRCDVTISGGSVSAGFQCQFPFKLFNMVYEHCTTAVERDNRPWCPTKVSKRSRKFRFGSENWGYCDPTCPFEDSHGNFIRQGTTTTIPPTTTTSKQRTTSIPPRPAVYRPSWTTSRSIETKSINTTTTPTTPATTTVMTAMEFDSNIPDGIPGSNSGKWIPDRRSGHCGTFVSNGYVVGGSRALRGEFPFMALMGYASLSLRRKYDYLCGGALINRRYVVTAAHCHDPSSNPVIRVILGEFEIGQDPDCNGCTRIQEMDVEDVLLHPGWNKDHFLSQGNDIALVRTSKPAITFYEFPESIVSPICLPIVGVDHMSDMDSFTIAGWGKIRNFDERGSTFAKIGAGHAVLQKLKLKRIEMEMCEREFEKISDNQICAGGQRGKDSCSGDSGGPLIYQSSLESPMILAGIVSSGSSQCGIGKSGLYTDISKYLSWIKHNLRD